MILDFSKCKTKEDVQKVYAESKLKEALDEFNKVRFLSTRKGERQ